MLAAIVASWASLRQHLIDKEVRDNARFDRIERKVGISNGGAVWVDKEFCREVHRAFSVDVEGLKEATTALSEKVDEAIESGRESVRIGHDDRMAIKARLVRVEEALTK
jgi:hypothetical protein